MDFLKKIIYGVVIFFALLLAVFYFFVYAPKDFVNSRTIKYTAPKGWGDDEIAIELEKMGIIRSNYAFRFYVIISGNHGKIQAGRYQLGSYMSVAKIVKMLASGQVVNEKITILEGWNLKEISNYLEIRKICANGEFSLLAKEDFTNDFIFLQDKPQNASLEGYIFPDTYEIPDTDVCRQVAIKALRNFGKKINQDLSMEIIRQKKTVFDIVTVASLLEKEVVKQEDKKIVAGIIYNRLYAGMPLQIDATINYITGKKDRGALIEDTKIDSPYNTYKYAGLPAGPISNPGMESILAAIYPTESNYFYYLSATDGTTVFSRTLEEHNTARAKYLQ